MPDSLPCLGPTGFTGVSYLALTGSLTGVVTGIAGANMLLLFPFKFAVAYTLLYHYLGGIRHFVWDYHTIGNQNDTSSLLEKEKVVLISKGLFAGSVALAFIVACM